MPIIQIDWTSIKGLFGDVTAIYALTHRQASLLLSLSEQLTWEKTFREFGYDFADKDSLDLEIADLQNNLVSPVNLVDLIALIDEVEDLLRQLNDHAGCCDYDAGNGTANTDVVVDGVGDVPPNVVSAGYAASSSDWTGFDDYKCMISHIVVTDLEEKLRNLAPYVDTAGAIIGGIGAVIAVVTGIFTGGSTLILAGVLAGAASVAAVYENLTSGSFLDNLADEVATNHDELACAIYAADGSDSAGDALSDKIDELWTDVEALILKSMNHRATIRALYAGRYNEEDTAQRLVDLGFDVGDFDCSCPQYTPPAGYQFEAMTAASFSPVNGGTGTDLGGGLFRFTGGANAGADVTINYPSGGQSAVKGCYYVLEAKSGVVTTWGIQSGSGSVVQANHGDFSVGDEERGRKTSETGLNTWCDATNKYEYETISEVAQNGQRFIQNGGGGSYTCDIRCFWVKVA